MLLFSAHGLASWSCEVLTFVEVRVSSGIKTTTNVDAFLHGIGGQSPSKNPISWNWGWENVCPSLPPCMTIPARSFIVYCLFSKNNPRPHPTLATGIEIQRWYNSRPDSHPRNCEKRTKKSTTEAWRKCTEIIFLVQGDRWTNRGPSRTRGAEASSPSPSIGDIHMYI